MGPSQVKKRCVRLEMKSPSKWTRRELFSLLSTDAAACLSTSSIPITQPLWALIDVYGCTEQVTFLGYFGREPAKLHNTGSAIEASLPNYPSSQPDDFGFHGECREEHRVCRRTKTNRSPKVKLRVCYPVQRKAPSPKRGVLVCDWQTGNVLVWTSSTRSHVARPCLGKEAESFYRDMSCQILYRSVRNEISNLC